MSFIKTVFTVICASLCVCVCVCVHERVSHFLSSAPALPAEGFTSACLSLLQVASLRQQLTELGVGPGRGAGHCGAESGCGAVLQQMERTHREVMEELEKQHSQQICALEREQDALLKEESDATARGTDQSLQSTRYSGRSFCLHIFWILC